MKKVSKGFTSVELMIVLFFGFIILSAISSYFINNMGWTETRAKENAMLFVNNNHLSLSRISCAGDSDNDGYGSCTVVTAEGENIILQCPTNFVSVRIFGATGCKEITGQQKFIVRR